MIVVFLSQAKQSDDGGFFDEDRDEDDALGGSFHVIFSLCGCENCILVEISQ